MIISQTPLRVSFFGGGTDYPAFFESEPGAVLAAAIDKFSYITASPFPSQLFDYSIRIAYRKVELVSRTDEIEHRVYRACLKRAGIERDIELHNMADLPSFSGLGSSSTFTVGLLHALHAFLGRHSGPRELAAEAIAVEQDVLAENVGCQDQVLAAYGGFNLVQFEGSRSFDVRPVDLPLSRLRELEERLLLVFTGITRRASDVAGAQIRKVGDNRPMLRRMREMAFAGFDLLKSGKPIAAFGHLLHEAWTAKRSLDGAVSNDEIDALYERGHAAGALGGKLLGAGGGGFLLFFVEPSKRSGLQAAFPGHATVAVRLAAPGSRIAFRRDLLNP